MTSRSLVPVPTAELMICAVPQRFLEVLEKGFVDFLAEVKPGEIKKEYLLPAVVDQLIQENKAEVAVLKTHDTWFGVTYQEDKEKVMESFKELVKKGVYKEELFS